ncbi:serine proteinase [Crepidotus variabilis]|uniref:Serine proteinase n=1 Tax=Crepidotus variabilis TaxID=179855 RepID=A0A9P6EFL0_9AGAR|nr:serine proteinase [Crepidotus variabilis]
MFAYKLHPLAASTIAAATSPLAIQTYKGETSGRHIITLKQGASKNGFINKATLSSDMTHKWDIINAFAGQFTDDNLNALRSDPNVESVTEDGIMHILGTQTDAPWGLERISTTPKLTDQNSLDLTHKYVYKDDKLGSGVDIYIVDTGIRTTHVTFGGRAHWGGIFGGHEKADNDGHGTHCAGIAAGDQYGVAKKANLIAVKVIHDDGSGGPASDVISGLQYVKDQAATSGRPSIASISLGGYDSKPLDDAIASLTKAGVHVVVAAGNDDIDAGTGSPGRAPSAVTVGASAIYDARAAFSNHGPVVDIFAPGLDVISSWNTNDTATNIGSGTSMAAPHIAGLIAYLIARDGNDTPAAISTKLQNQSLKGVLKDMPSGTLNYLAHND